MSSALTRLIPRQLTTLSAQLSTLTRAQRRRASRVEAALALAAAGTPAMAAASSDSPQTFVPVPVAERVRRTAPQLLDDELIAQELVAGAPTKKGGRLLTDDRDPWTHNAWDKIPWDEEQEAQARAAVERQRQQAVPVELQERYNADPAGYWDSFYANVKDNFFNDRAWLRNEFPELSDAIRPDAGPKTIVEIGCGPGNTLFPLYSFNENPELQLHGYDFSKQAVDLVISNPSFDPKHLTSSVWDLSSSSALPPTLPPRSVDIAILIFCFSALHPSEWDQAFHNIWSMLKPGGLVLFRDYGRNDMAQLRFKAGRLMQGGLYVRGDGTRVYFFERDELLGIFGELKKGEPGATKEEEKEEVAGGQVDEEASGENPDPKIAPEATKMRSLDRRLELLQLGVDRRLLLNRKKQLKMYRVWLQGRWRKPLDATD